MTSCLIVTNVLQMLCFVFLGHNVGPPPAKVAAIPPPIVSVKPSNVVYHPSGLTYAQLPVGSGGVTLAPSGHHPASMQPQFIPVNYMLPNGHPVNMHATAHAGALNRQPQLVAAPPQPHLQPQPPMVAVPPQQPQLQPLPLPQSVMGKGMHNDLANILNPKMPLPGRFPGLTFLKT